MFADEFKHEVGGYLKRKAEVLLESQRATAVGYYSQRTGRLSDALQGSPSVQSMSVTVSYPKHIRFLDMKKTRHGKKKKRYAAIYNKEVYGHLKSGVWKFLMAALPKQMIRTMEDTIKGIDK